MFQTEAWSLAHVAKRTHWSEGLFTITMDETRQFHAGQFVKLGLEVDGEPVSRAYSISSAPGEPLEFYIVAVEGGALSPRLHDLQPGDPVWVHNRILGHFCADEVPEGGDLWMVGTGTGLGPYIAMLREGSLFDRFERVIVAHGSCYAAQLGYRDELTALHEAGRIRYVPSVTRDDDPGCLSGRITALYADGRLEAAADAPITAERSHVMLCGNPELIKQMMATLKADRGMTLNTPRRPGQIHIERYW